MRLLVLSRFSTMITVHGDNIRMAATPGTILEVDEDTAAALRRDVGPFLTEARPAGEVLAEIRDEAETVSEAPVVEMVEVPADIVAPPRVARTRQVARKPARPGPKAKVKK